MGIYLEIYNLGEPEGQGAPDGEVTYQITRAGAAGELLLDVTEQFTDIRGASATQVTIEKLLPLEALHLEPGEYELTLKVKDRIRNEVLTPSSKFKVI